MAQPQENAMGKDLMDSPEWVVIADDWVDIDIKLDDDDDNSDQAKSKNELHDHVTSPVVEENQNTSGPKVLTRYVDVPEEMVNFFTGKDVVMDLQIASGAMIQITKAYRRVRLIGNSENVEKGEKLVKAVLAVADAGGSALLRKHECDSSDYDSKYGHHQKQEPWYQSHNYSHFPESWGPFQFDRKRSSKRAHGRR